MPASIGNLPVELLEAIFHHVHANRRSPDSFKLKSVIIRFLHFQTTTCGYYMQNGRMQRMEFDIGQYSAAIQNARKDGIFQSLEFFLIISKQWRAYHDQACKWAIYAHDLTCNETVVFPRIYLEQPPAYPGVLRYTELQILVFIRVPNSCSFILPQHLGKEYVGDYLGSRHLVRFLQEEET